MKKRLAIGLVNLVFILGSALASNFLSNTAYALDSSDFKAGKIISDSNFFNGEAMTAEQVQQFLEAKVPTCDTDGSEPYGDTGMTRAEWAEANDKPSPPYICLKSYKQDVPKRNPEDLLCDGIDAADNQRASKIIDMVARSCGVSQKVLLVLLEKEQSLVTDDWPWPTQYRSATGYGCPDSAPCDSEYYGFFNQVYHAARIYKYYAKYPDSFNHIAGETNFVRYNPNSKCGGSNVLIQNQATAGLYNYTPYQPNAGSLAHKLEGGRFYSTSYPDCGAYGNINFWLLYTKWFGNTLKESQPIVPISGDWSDGRADELGFKRGNEYYYDTNYDGAANINFGFGRITDKVLVGDWDGDGKDEVGLRRGDHYYFNNNNDNTADVDFGIGRETDQSFVGDWDGDGRDTIGLKRGNQYYLDNNNDRVADIYIGIGRDTDQVMVGDWDGNGTDNIGLKRGDHYYLDTNNVGNSEIDFGIGRITDKVIVGDWDGNGTSNIGLKRGSDYFLDTDNNRLANIYVGIGRDTDKVMVGDWDGNGTSNIGLRRYNRIYFDTNNDGTADVSFILNYF